MIQNEHQYKVTKGEIDKLQQVIDKLLEQQNIPPSQLAGMQNSFQTQIDPRSETLRERMQMEIRAYDDLKAGDCHGGSCQKNRNTGSLNTCVIWECEEK
jgi:succinylglutamate desuccinylase